MKQAIFNIFPHHIKKQSFGIASIGALAELKDIVDLFTSDGVELIICSATVALIIATKILGKRYHNTAKFEKDSLSYTIHPK